MKVRAGRHGRSIAAEIREILDAAVRPAERVKLGSLLASIGREAGLSDGDVDSLQSLRDEAPVEPMSFE
ncbi:plasmid stability protein [Rhizobium pisi]